MHRESIQGPRSLLHTLQPYPCSCATNALRLSICGFCCAVLFRAQSMQLLVSAYFPSLCFLISSAARRGPCLALFHKMSRRASRRGRQGYASQTLSTGASHEFPRNEVRPVCVSQTAQPCNASSSDQKGVVVPLTPHFVHSIIAVCCHPPG